MIMVCKEDFNVVKFFKNFYSFAAEDCTTVFIRIFAAMGHATDLKTVTSDAVKMGLTAAVETGSDIVKCIESAACDEMKRLPVDHYLNKTKYM